jgi:transcriptional regulator with XRE-family HTH domain
VTNAQKYRLGRRIRDARIAAGLDQKSCAKLATISPAALSRIESGQRSPSVETLRKLRDALCLSDAEFLAWVDAA